VQRIGANSSLNLHAIDPRFSFEPLGNHTGERRGTGSQGFGFGHRKSQAQAVRGTAVVIELRSRCEENTRDVGVRQQVAGIHSLGKLDPHLEPTVGSRPARTVRHLGSERVEQRIAALAQHPAHASEMPIVGPRSGKFGQRGLKRKRVREICRLLQCEQGFDQPAARGDRADPSARKE